MAEQSLVQMVSRAGIPVDTSSATLPQQSEILVSDAGAAITNPPTAPQPRSQPQTSSSSHNPFGSYTPDQRFGVLPDFDDQGRFQRTEPYYTAGQDELANRIARAGDTRANLLTNLPAPSGSNPVLAYYNIEKNYSQPYINSLMQEASDRRAFREATGQDLTMVPSRRPETVPEVPEGVEPISTAASGIIPTLNTLEAARLDYQKLSEVLRTAAASVGQMDSPASLQVIIDSLAEIEARRRAAGDSIELDGSLRTLQSQLVQRYAGRSLDGAAQKSIAVVLTNVREAALLELEEKTRQQISVVNGALPRMNADEQVQANLLLQNLYESEPAQARAGGLVWITGARAQLELDRLGLEYTGEIVSPGTAGNFTTAQEAQRAQVLVAYNQVYRGLVGKVNEVRGRIGATQLQAPGFEAFIALPGLPREQSNALLTSLFNQSLAPANFKTKAMELLIAARTPRRQDTNRNNQAQSQVSPPESAADSSSLTPNSPAPPQVVATSLPLPPTLPLEYGDDAAFDEHLLPPEVRPEPQASVVASSASSIPVILSRPTITTSRRPSNLTVIGQQVAA